MLEHKHTCLFYRSKDEVTEVAVPFLQSGLANHEFCLWVVPEIFSKEEAITALSRAVGPLEPYFQSGQLEIGTEMDYYLKSGTFTAYEMMEYWDEKEKEILSRGFTGISIVGDGGWGADEHWINLLCYEQDIDNTIDGRKIKAVCTYRIDCFDITKIIAIGHAHHTSLVKGPRQWNNFHPKDFRNVRMQS